MENKKIIYKQKVKNVLGLLSDKGLKYFILNGYNDISPDTDIDIAVNDLSKFKKYISELDFKIVQEFHHSPYAMNIFFMYENEIFNFDIYTKYFHKNYTFFDFRRYISKARDIDGLKIIPVEIESSYFFKKRSIKKDFDKKKDEFNKIVKPNSKNKLPSGYFDIYGIFLNILRIYLRALKPNGLCIAVLGVDGSGKSTLIKSINNNCSKLFRTTHNFHLKPRLIGQKAKGKAISNPLNKKPYHFFMSLAKLFLTWIDYFLGYFVLIYPKKIRSGLVIFDRYKQDLYVSPERFRISRTNSYFLKMLYRFMPNADFVIFLKGDPKKIFARKCEISIDEIISQQEKFKDLIVKNKNYVILDTVSNNEEAINQLAYDAIINFIKKRYS
tara:strand:+ start:17653 stop:18804 length:1152 start_codon:yes stop_codon:yes gene_type:complete